MKHEMASGVMEGLKRVLDYLEGLGDFVVMEKKMGSAIVVRVYILYRV